MFNLLKPKINKKKPRNDRKMFILLLSKATETLCLNFIQLSHDNPQLLGFTNEKHEIVLKQTSPTPNCSYHQANSCSFALSMCM